MKVCTYCEKLGTLRWGPRRPAPPRTDTYHSYSHYELHPGQTHLPTLKDVEISSSTCPLCKLLFELFLQANGAEVLETLLGEKSWTAAYGLQISRTYTDDFRSMWLEIWRRVPNWDYKNTWKGLPLIICLEEDSRIKRAIWNSSSPFQFDQSVPVLREWLEDCTQRHEPCATPVPFLPKRLIKIECVGDYPMPRIIDGVDAKHHGGKYIALSYCWGFSETMLRTTMKTLRDFTFEIPMASLPNTYRDAFVVAKSIGIQYLWIDSLCIVQDDESDWHSQSAEMASIYRNAYLTIAAGDSFGSDGGCFRQRKPSIPLVFSKAPSEDTPQIQTETHRTPLDVKKYQPLWFKSNNDTNDSSSNTIVTDEPSLEVRSRVRELPLIKELIFQSPLSRRAWTFQETTLSKRVLYFTKDQLIWRCQEGFLSEDGHIGTVFELDPEKLPDRDYNYESFSVRIKDGDPRDATSHTGNGTGGDSWWEWVYDYSSRKLTFASDKYAAFAGITVSYQKWNDCLIIAGLRSTHLPEDLFWIRPASESSPIVGNAPSWSWLSFDGPVCSFSPEYQNNHLKAKIIDYNVIWSSQPLTSSISCGTLTIRGRISEAVVGKKSAQTYPRWGGERSDYFQLESMPAISGSRNRMCKGKCVFDAEVLKEGEMVFCLLITESYSVSFEYSWNILVLRLVEGDGNTFRRIGVGCIHDSYVRKGSATEIEFFDEIEPRIITLV